VDKCSTEYELKNRKVRIKYADTEKRILRPEQAMVRTVSMFTNMVHSRNLVSRTKLKKTEYCFQS